MQRGSTSELSFSQMRASTPASCASIVWRTWSRNHGRMSSGAVITLRNVGERAAPVSVLNSSATSAPSARSVVNSPKSS
jgi:hypothetical protein